LNFHPVTGKVFGKHVHELSEENLQSHSFHDKKKCCKSQREEIEELIDKDPHYLHIFQKNLEYKKVLYS